MHHRNRIHSRGDAIRIAAELTDTQREVIVRCAEEEPYGLFGEMPDYPILQSLEARNLVKPTNNAEHPDDMLFRTTCLGDDVARAAREKGNQK